MKFEITKKVRTPDGVEHDSIEAARAHMWGANLDILAGASRADLEEAISWQGETEEMPAETLALRHAIREVFLAAWPRASKGQPRKPREAASEAPASQERPPSAPSEEPAPATKRNHGKKAA